MHKRVFRNLSKPILEISPSMIVFYINDINKLQLYTYLCTGNILIESLNPFAKGLLSIFRRVI